MSLFNLDSMKMFCVPKKQLVDSIAKCASLLMGDGLVTGDFAREAKLMTACSELDLLENADIASQVIFQERRRKAAQKDAEEIASAFDAAGVPYAVIKGFSFECVVYGNRALRDVGDIDIMIRPEDAFAAHRVLVALGYSQRLGCTSAAAGKRTVLAVQASRMQTMSSGRPLRRFPFKDAYCPYIKLDSVTVELHDGFRGVPRRFTDEVVSRAAQSPVHLVLDENDTFVFLIVNIFENSESFYSNCYDDKIALRDYVDLACFIRGRIDGFDWPRAERLLHELMLSEKAGHVLNNLDEIYPGEFDDVLTGIPRLKSMWGQSLLMRMANGELRRRCTLTVFRQSVRGIAEKSIFGPALCLCEGVKADGGDGVAPTMRLLVAADGDMSLCIDNLCISREGQHLISIKAYPLGGDEGPIAYCLNILLLPTEPQAFLQKQHGFPDGFVDWQRSGLELQALYTDVNKGVAVSLPGEIAEKVLLPDQTAVTACVYDRNCGNEFWTKCRGKSLLIGDVPVNHLSLYSDRPVVSLYIEFSFGRCVVSACDNAIAQDVANLFGNCFSGVPVDCDTKVERNYIFRTSGLSGYSLVAGGSSRGLELPREEIITCFLQDVTDWAVTQLMDTAVVVHAAVNFADDGAVLLMGESGSGKTSLALALAACWPLGGDECACIDFEKGTAWCEPMPINVKSENADVLRRLGTGDSVECVGGMRGVTYSYPLTTTNADPNPFQSRKIKALLFPSYDSSCGATEICKLPAEQIVQKILGSLAGLATPSNLFRAFVGMVSRYDITMLSVRYGNAVEAARALAECAADAKEAK